MKLANCSSEKLSSPKNISSQSSRISANDSSSKSISLSLLSAEATKKSLYSLRISFARSALPKGCVDNVSKFDSIQFASSSFCHWVKDLRDKKDIKWRVSCPSNSTSLRSSSRMSSLNT